MIEPKKTPYQTIPVTNVILEYNVIEPTLPVNINASASLNRILSPDEIIGLFKPKYRKSEDQMRSFRW